MLIKNKMAHIVYLTVYVVLGFWGILGSLGYFTKDFNNEFLVFYTNLSNYICVGVMLGSLIVSLKTYDKRSNPYSFAPKFKFLSVILILVTFLVYNILLAKDDYKSLGGYLLNPSNLMNHCVLPLMFIFDWILFYEHGKTRWFDPLLCTVMPLIYVVYILIRAPFATYPGATVYPYFFLNLEKLGLGGFIGWVAILLVVFIVIGYIFYLCDNYKKLKSKFAKKK